MRLGQLLLASDRKLVKYIRHTAPCISTVVATAALLYSHVLLRGMELSAALVKACANQLKNMIVSAYALRDDFFDRSPLALVWVLFVGALTSLAESPGGVWFRLCLQRACEKDGERVIERVDTLCDARKFGTPRPFYWMLQEDCIQISSVNTRIL